MLKKISALLLALVLVLGLAACGGKKAPAPADDKTPTQSGETTDNTQETENTDVPQNTENTGDSQNTDSVDEVEFQRGTVDGSTYTSDLLGITATLDENWIIASDEQLAQLGGLVVDSFEDEDVKKLLSDGSTVYEFYALNQKDNSSVNITVQELGRLGGIMVDEDAYADANLKSLPEVLSSGGITVTKLEKTTVEFAGSTHAALSLEGTVNDVALYETIVLLKNGPYMAVVTAASFDEANPPVNLLALFQGLQ